MSRPPAAPRTPGDLLVPPPSSSASAPAANANPLVFRLPASAFLAPIPGGSSAKKKGKHGKGGRRDRDQVYEYAAPKKPPKRKPLGEVLPGLISRIKKRDDYAFFLKPVDLAVAPGYKDVVKNPMDFGTMTKKVQRGRYKSMDDFTKDFQLVIDNAKLFNPPGSIYYTEAERLHAWGLDAITKANETVDPDAYVPDIDVDEDAPAQSGSDHEQRAVSVPEDTSTPRRPPRATDEHIALSLAGETGAARRLRVRAHALRDGTKVEEDGGLPGASDGLGAFPAGHGAGALLVQWKLRARKFTKKERLKMEKEGPPRAADCSLDAARLEHPFSALAVLREPPLSRPVLVPLAESAQADDEEVLPGPIALPFRPGVPREEPPSAAAAGAAATPKMKHWTRVPPSKAKGKEREDTVPPTQSLEARDPRTTDWGVYALLDAIMQHQASQPGPSSKPATAPPAPSSSAAPLSFPTETALFERIRADIDAGPSTVVSELERESAVEWPHEDVPPMEGTIRELVYGGAEGLAYVSSLARFVHGAEKARLALSPEDLAEAEQPSQRHDEPMDEDHQDDDEDDKARVPKTKWRQGPLHAASLAEYVEREIVDPLTDGRHALLRGAGRHLHFGGVAGEDDTRVRTALVEGPRRRARRQEAAAMCGDKLDLAAVLRQPGELYAAEAGWKALMATYHSERERRRVLVVKEEPMDVDGGAGVSPMSTAMRATQAAAAQFAAAQREPTLVEYALRRTARTIDEMVAASSLLADITVEDAESKGELQAEDDEMRALRLHLLALAKRAPIKMIDAVPVELVPPHIRHAFEGFIRKDPPTAPA